MFILLYWKQQESTKMNTIKTIKLMIVLIMLTIYSSFHFSFPLVPLKIQAVFLFVLCA